MCGNYAPYSPTFFPFFVCGKLHAEVSQEKKKLARSINFRYHYVLSLNELCGDNVGRTYPIEQQDNLRNS